MALISFRTLSASTIIIGGVAEGHLESSRNYIPTEDPLPGHDTVRSPIITNLKSTNMFGRNKKRIRDLEGQVDEWRGIATRFHTLSDKQSDLITEAVAECMEVVTMAKHYKHLLEWKDPTVYSGDLALLCNRSDAQSRMLFELCGLDMLRMLHLEGAIRRQHISYCPDSVKEVWDILEKDLKPNQQCETEMKDIRTDLS